MKATILPALALLMLGACSHQNQDQARAPEAMPPDDPPPTVTKSNTSTTRYTSNPASNPARTTTTNNETASTTWGTSHEAPAQETPVAPDNTKVNERDAKAGEQSPPTPLDQKENESDLKATQLIRKAVMNDDSLSFTAKNVKIITANGKVTLRGPVNTARESAAIEAAARRVAGVRNVDNQLEVKP